VSRRVHEIKHQIISICVKYMAEVKSDSEMRFLLLSKDLDNRDALTIIYEYELVELL
jgi:hypothetical protein